MQKEEEPCQFAVEEVRSNSFLRSSIVEGRYAWLRLPNRLLPTREGALLLTAPTAPVVVYRAAKLQFGIAGHVKLVQLFHCHHLRPDLL